MVGDHVGRYRVLRPLGSGGMGEVYLAEDPTLQRQVALKILSRPDEKSRRRFVREAITSSKLSHPNVAVVYEAGEADGGIAFISMQYVDGVTLTERLLRGAMPIGEVRRIGAEVADALDDAHRHGIVHRDIKPGNIMLDARGHARVLDFGIAKLVELDAMVTPDASTDVAPSTAGKFIGTLQYVSPEQAEGGVVDGRSDIFSLGIVLYEMVEGVNPFAAGSFLDTVRKIREVTPPPIDRANCPPELQRIIFKCLEKSPSRRYQSARDLALDLEAIDRPSQKPPRPRQRIAVIGALLAIAVATLLLWQWPERAAALTPRDTILLADFTNETKDPVFEKTLRDALAIQLGQTPYLNLFPDSATRETLRFMNRAADERITPAIAREICQRQGLKGYLTGSIAQLGTTYVITLEADRGDTGDALVREQVEADRKEDVLHALGAAAVKFRRDVGESLQSVQRFDAPIEQATTGSLEALRAFSLADQKENASLEFEAISLYKRAIELDPEFAIAYARLSVSYNNTLQHAAAADAAGRAYALRGRSTERERCYIEQLYLTSFTGDLAKVSEVATLCSQTYPRDARIVSLLALSLVAAGRFDDALTTARRAMQLPPRRLGPYDLATIALLGLNRGAEARASLRQAHAAGLESAFLHVRSVMIAAAEDDQRTIDAEIAWGRTHPIGYFVLYTAADALFSRGAPRVAKRYFGEAVDLALKSDDRQDAAYNLVEPHIGDAVLGHCGDQTAIAKKVEALSSLPEIVAQLAMVQASCGRTSVARAKADELLRQNPENTLYNCCWVPVIRGLAALSEGNAQAAVDVLKPALRYDHEFDASGWPLYVRSVAYLALRDGANATAEFEKILTHRYLYATRPYFGLAMLGAARAAAMNGDTARAKQLYTEFLTWWKNADPDLPQLVQAKRELAALPSESVSNPRAGR